MYVEAITLVVAAIAVIAAWFAAFQASKSAKIAAKFGEAEISSQFLAEYAGTEMYDAMADLQQYADNPSNNLKKLETSPGTLDPLTVDVRKAMRKVYYFYLRAYLNHAEGYISDDAMKTLANLPGYRYLFELVGPLYRAVYTNAGAGEVVTLSGETEDRNKWIEELESSKKFPPPPLGATRVSQDDFPVDHSRFV